MRLAGRAWTLGLGLLAVALAGCQGGGEPVSRVLFVTLDTTRADRIGCYGYEEATTPWLDSLAAEGARFTEAVSPIATTLPSHSSMFTGLYPQDHGVRYNLAFKLSPEATTLAERFSQAGFATAGFPASFIVSREYGVAQGFDHWVEPPAQSGAADVDAIQGRAAGEIVDDAMAWIDQRGPEESWFLWAHFYDAHAPYSPPFPYSDTFRDRPYDGEIAYVDAQLGRLFERLRTDPSWSRTLVVVVADHGEGLYDHGERFHGNLIYQTTQHVPLIIRAPGFRPRVVDEPVSLVDLAPTMLDLAGLPPAEPSRGISLRGALDGAVPERRDLYFESLAGSLNYGWAELRGVRYGDWKLIDSDRPELYALDEDGGELENRAALDAARLQELRAALEPLSLPIDDAHQAESAHEDASLDAETAAFLASLGYVGGGAGGSAANAPHPHDLIDLEGELLAAQGAVAFKQWSRLEEVCRYVLSRDPTNKFGLSNLVESLLWQQRPAEAEPIAADAIRAYPDAEFAYLLLTKALQTQGRIAEALEVLEQGLQQSSADSEALLYLSVVAAFELGEDDVCDERLKDAVLTRPDSGRLRVLGARCRLREGDPDAAIDALRQAWDRGFRQFDRLLETEEFEGLKAREDYQALIADVEAERAARTAGEATP